jgi:hypothetical protein
MFPDLSISFSNFLGFSARERLLNESFTPLCFNDLVSSKWCNSARWLLKRIESGLLFDRKFSINTLGLLFGLSCNS